MIDLRTAESIGCEIVRKLYVMRTGNVFSSKFGFTGSTGSRRFAYNLINILGRSFQSWYTAKRPPSVVESVGCSVISVMVEKSAAKSSRGRRFHPSGTAEGA